MGRIKEDQAQTTGMGRCTEERPYNQVEELQNQNAALRMTISNQESEILGLYRKIDRMRGDY